MAPMWESFHHNSRCASCNESHQSFQVPLKGEVHMKKEQQQGMIQEQNPHQEMQNVSQESVCRDCDMAASVHANHDCTAESQVQQASWGMCFQIQIQSRFVGKSSSP